MIPVTAAKLANAIAKPRPAIAAVEPRRVPAISRLVRVPNVTNATTAAAHNARSTVSANRKRNCKLADFQCFRGHLNTGFH